MITSHTKHLLVGALALALGAVGALGTSAYLILADGSRLLSQSQLVADQTVQAQSYAALGTLLAESTDERNELGTYFLTEGETIDFLSQIETIAREQQVELVTDALNVSEGKEFNTLEVTFSINGSAVAVEKMVTILETLPYASVLKQFSFTTDTEVGVKSKVSLVVTLRTHGQ